MDVDSAMGVGVGGPNGSASGGILLWKGASFARSIRVIFISPAEACHKIPPPYCSVIDMSSSESV